MKSTARFMKNLWCDEGGASAVEYALILALLGAAAVWYFHSQL